MSEEVNNQETQPTETPPVVTSTETPPEDGKLVETNPPESQVSTESKPPEKTPEQLKDDVAFFQTAKDELDVLRGEPQSETPPSTPQAQLPEQQRMPSNDELNDYLKENPVEGYRLLSDNITKNVTNTMSQLMSEQQTKIENEVHSREANRVLSDFASKTDTPIADVKAAVQHFKDLGVKAHPAVIADLAIQKIGTDRIVKSNQQQVTEATAKATEALKTQQMTTQPDGGVPTKEKGDASVENQVSDKFGKQKGSKNAFLN